MRSKSIPARRGAEETIQDLASTFLAQCERAERQPSTRTSTTDALAAAVAAAIKVRPRVAVASIKPVQPTARAAISGVYSIVNQPIDRERITALAAERLATPARRVEIRAEIISVPDNYKRDVVVVDEHALALHSRLRGDKRGGR